ncbi:Phosphatidylglycerophosphatase A [Ascidiaceihabitans donghaensis]|uniref:Phosphatidylglycerophosphatase A n=2 Tax=Ascidiaceihabitans donghaensis TaxID=1510460 RepID=A0A2R8BE21_9RHOB|nr:Phosphatidylglycerophosphatase A [Ascidiaceihabitans donghaensis]
MHGHLCFGETMMLARMIGTVLGVGYLRPAPGTWGSLVALPWALLLHVLGGFWLLAIGVLAAFVKGWWATAQMTNGSEDHDPSEIVIDEVVGQWIALLPISYGAWANGIPITALWPGWIAAFVLFRLFDIWKPWLVGWADRRGDALGVMLDDVIAGVFAAIGVMVLAGLAHGMLMQ